MFDLSSRGSGGLRATWRPSDEGSLHPSAVQFTATGHYNGAPFTVTPQPASWGACYQNAPTTEVSVASTGSAQCQAQGGPPVTYSVFAFDMTTCNVINACGGGCTVVGDCAAHLPHRPLGVRIIGKLS